MFLSSRRVEWYIIWPGKVKLKIWPQVRVMTWPKHIMLHIIRFLSIRQTHQTSFEACILSQSKVIVRKLLVTYGDVTRRPMLVAEVIGAPVRLVSITFCVWLLRMVLTQTKMKWNLSHGLIIGRSQNWPDIRSNMYKIQDIHFVDHVTLNNLCKFYSDRSIDVSRGRVLFYSQVGSLDLVTWPLMTWSCFFSTYAEKMQD